MNPTHEQLAEPAPDLAEGDRMPIRSQDFRVAAGDKVDLDKWPTSVDPVAKSRKQYRKLLTDDVEALSSLQRLH